MHDIAAHLVVPLVTGMGTVVREMAKARGNFDRANMAMTRSVARKSPAELSGLLRRHAGSHFTPPGLGSVAPLADAIVHGQDARRPLGIVRDIPAARQLAILDFQVSPLAGRGFVPKGRAAGLRFAASDLDWSHGDGPLVEGKAEALMMALSGRRVALSDLSGDGVRTLGVPPLRRERRSLTSRAPATGSASPRRTGRGRGRRRTGGRGVRAR